VSALPRPLRRRPREAGIPSADRANRPTRSDHRDAPGPPHARVGDPARSPRTGRAGGAARRPRRRRGRAGASRGDPRSGPRRSPGRDESMPSRHAIATRSIRARGLLHGR
jgi:hypothetical protein